MNVNDQIDTPIVNSETQVAEAAPVEAGVDASSGNAGTDGDWSQQPAVEAVVEEAADCVSVEEAKAIFTENPNVACVLTTEGRLYREGYFA